MKMSLLCLVIVIGVKITNDFRQKMLKLNKNKNSGYLYRGLL